MVFTKQVVPLLLVMLVPLAAADDPVADAAAQNETLASSVAPLDACLADALDEDGSLYGAAGDAPPPSDVGGLSSVNEPANAFSPAVDFGGAVWLLAGIAVGAAAAMWARSRMNPRRAAAPRAPPAAAGEDLRQRAQENPLDAHAQLALALRLLDDKRADLALPRLERAFQLNPADLVTFLQEPTYERHRQDPAVRAMLLRYRRDLDRRLHTGYA